MPAWVELSGIAEPEPTTIGFQGGSDQEGIATEAEKRASYAAALIREIAGVDHRLAELVDDPPEQWHIDRFREELLSEKRSALSELGRLGVTPPKRARR